MAERVPTLLPDARLAARHIAIKHQLLRRTHWGLLESRTDGEPDVVFNKKSTTLFICRDVLGLVQANRHAREPLEKIASISMHEKPEGITFSITPIHNDVGIKVYEKYLTLKGHDLPRDATVYIGKTEYIFRCLTDVVESPSHASRYKIASEMVKEGGQGVVRFGETVNDEDALAVAIKRTKVKPWQLQNMALQLSVWEALDHPAVLPLRDYWFETDDKAPETLRVYMVSELAPYGTLKDYVMHEGPLSPPLARSVLIQIIDGLLNILVFRKDAGSITVRICDFGLIRQRKKDPSRNVEPAGSAGWAPPDIVNHVYNEKSESFGVGAIMFFLVPQMDKVPEEMMKKIGDAGELLKRLLEPQNDQRISLEDASDHSFLAPAKPLEPLAFNNPLVQNFLTKGSKGNYSAARTAIPQFAGPDDLGPPEKTEPPETPTLQHAILGNGDGSPRKSNIPEVIRTTQIHGEVNFDGSLVINGNVVVTGGVIVNGTVEVLGEALIRGPLTLRGQLTGGHHLDHDCENYRSEAIVVDVADPNELPGPPQAPIPVLPTRQAAEQALREAGYRSGLSRMASVWPGADVPEAALRYAWRVFDCDPPEVDNGARSDDTVMAGPPGEASANPIPLSSTGRSGLVVMDSVAEVEMQLLAAVEEDSTSPDLAGPAQDTVREDDPAVDAHAGNDIAESSNHVARPRRSARRTAGRGRGDEAGTTTARVDQGEQQDSDDESNGLNNKRRKTRSSTRNKKLKTTKN
ncbi:kinase-like protein [Punctularia strigosozonata HHB-11173 SS5]|uniref:Kinase-like protein n=1 Tax=Punctularia strigosozonata (strain HHB-11173) TaxID=741275 RepID=R7S4L2_PUNST|nr:kinase-like protein [Punctularia strigosozonata HHB-11173 SS5]EIN04186.1 kinase-like protein [Punctularia strigosozonata HHB-11173 SS5]